MLYTAMYCLNSRFRARAIGNSGDAAVGKSSLLVRLTDQRFLANPDPTVRVFSSIRLPVYEFHHAYTAGCRIWLETHHNTGGEQSGQAPMCVPHSPPVAVPSPAAASVLTAPA